MNMRVATSNSWGMPPVSPMAGTFQLPMDYNPNLTTIPDINGVSANAMSPAGALSAMPNFSATPSAPGGFMDKMLGYRAADGTQFAGWGGLALGAGQGIMNSFLGMQQLGVAKDQLAQGKRQFEINFGAQQKLTNSRMEDRQAARVAANPNAYQSVGAYMAKNGI